MSQSKLSSTFLDCQLGHVDFLQCLHFLFIVIKFASAPFLIFYTMKILYANVTFLMWHDFNRFMLLKICCYTFATRLQLIFDSRKCNQFQRQLSPILDVGNGQSCCKLSSKISSRITIVFLIIF